MGGGGAMRAAAKVAGITVVNGGFRGVAAEHPICSASAAGKAARSVSALSSSSDDSKSGVATHGSPVDSSVHRPCWAVDDWEFAGGEEDVDPPPRVVFGGAPTLQEAQEATSDLKDALEKVYLSSPSANGHGALAAQELGVPLLPSSGELDTNTCYSTETTIAPSAPKNAIQAFRFLNGSPAVQGVVASIASDPNVWNAVLQNPTLQEFIDSQKSSALSLKTTPDVDEYSVDADFNHQSSLKKVDVSLDVVESGSGNVFTDIMQNIKLSVIDMMSSLSDFFQNLFGGHKTAAPDADDNMKPGLAEKGLGATFMGLAVMVIIMVVLKRG